MIRASTLNSLLFNTDISHCHVETDITFNWNLPKGKHIEHFNPLVKDRMGLNFFETYLRKLYVPTMKSLASIELDLYRNYKQKLLTKWVPIDMKFSNIISDDLSPLLYLQGIRDVDELTGIEFVKINNDEERTLYIYTAVLTAQLVNGIYDWSEITLLSNIETFLEQHPERIHSALLTFLENAFQYGFSNINPLPVIFEEYIRNNVDDKEMFCGLYNVYRQDVFNLFSDESLSNVITLCVDLRLRVPQNIIQKAYDLDHLLLHTLIDRIDYGDICMMLMDLVINPHAEYKDNEGRTVAMKFIIKFKNLPIMKFIHDPSITDNSGKTCRDYWILHIGNDVPQEINIPIYVVLEHGCDHFDNYEYMVNNKLYCDKCSLSLIDSSNENNTSEFNTMKTNMSEVSNNSVSLQDTITTEQPLSSSSTMPSLTRERVYTNSATCPICWNEYSKDTVFCKYIHCNHIMCEDCIRRTNICPLCRA